MEIISYLDLFLGALLNVTFYFYIVKEIFKLKMIKNKKRKLLTVIFLSLFLSIINVFNKNIFKAVLAIPLVAIGIQIIFDIKFTKAIYCTIVSSFYLLIGELFVALIFSILNINYSFVEKNVLGGSIGNIMVIISTLPFIYINFISKIFRKIYNIKINGKTISLVFVLFLTFGSAFVFKSSISIDNIIPTIMNFIIFLVFIILLYISYFENKKVNRISDEYNTLLNYLDEYEKELVEKRKLIHDFKNQLIIINSYSDEKLKLKEYLNGIIEEHKNIKETKIIKNIDKLPKGLKGLIYYKLSHVNSNISVGLNVKSKFDGFENLSPKDNKNILKIIGILLDNSIESCIESNNKYLLIEISMKNGIFNLEIINSTLNNVEKTKMMEIGFSTKGKNRGYGLFLVKDIIRTDNRYMLDFDILEKEVKTYFEMKIK